MLLLFIIYFVMIQAIIIGMEYIVYEKIRKNGIDKCANERYYI